MKTVALASMMLLGCVLANAVQAGDCTVILACERKRCLDVPGQFSQVFEDPSGGIGRTSFMHGIAYVFAAAGDVVPTIKTGKVRQDTRYVVWPDETGRGERGGLWLDATILAVKSLTWNGDTPSLSPTTSLMACSDGNG